MKILVDHLLIRKLLEALVGPPPLIQHMQATMSDIPPNPIMELFVAYNEGMHPSHRHIKSKGAYFEMARGKLQTDSPLADMSELVAYQDVDGHWWFRPPAEFDNDERFRKT